MTATAAVATKEEQVSTNKIEDVSLDSIQTTFFVRKKLDEDRVVQLALLMQNGATVPPIRITEDHQLIDGRHRIEAARLAGWATIKAEVSPKNADRGALIAEAFSANCGGSVPPTRVDILFTIQQLLQQGWGEGRIAKHFPFPPTVTRRYVNDTRSKIQASKVNQAVIDVRDRGFTLVQAAENRGIDPESIKAAMTKMGKKVAAKEDYMGNLTTRFRSLSKTNAHLFQKIFDAYENGEVGIDYVRELMDHTQALHAQAVKSFEGWRQRFASVLAEERTIARGGAK